MTLETAGETFSSFFPKLQLLSEKNFSCTFDSPAGKGLLRCQRNPVLERVDHAPRIGVVLLIFGN